MCSFVLFLVRFSLFFLCFFECFLVILLVVFLCLSSVLFSVHFFVLVPFPFYIHFPLVVVLFLPCFLGVFFVLVIVLLFVLFFLHFRVFFRALSGTQDKQPEYFAFWPLLFLVVTSEDQDMHNLYNMPGPTQPEQSTATNILDHICSDLIFSEPIWSDPSSQILEWRRTFHHSFCSKQLQKKNDRSLWWNGCPLRICRWLIPLIPMKHKIQSNKMNLSNFFDYSTMIGMQYGPHVGCVLASDSEIRALFSVHLGIRAWPMRQAWAYCCSKLCLHRAVQVRSCRDADAQLTSHASALNLGLTEGCGYSLEHLQAASMSQWVLHSLTVQWRGVKDARDARQPASRSNSAGDATLIHGLLEKPANQWVAEKWLMALPVWCSRRNAQTDARITTTSLRSVVHLL